MQNNEKMVCPACKVEMNHQVVKVDCTEATDKSESTDHAFGSILEELHSCPKCGTTAIRAERKVA